MSGTSTLVARTPRVDDIVANDEALLEMAKAEGNKLDEAKAAALLEVEAMGETWAKGQGSLTQAAWKFASDVAGKTFTKGDAKAVYLAVVRGFNRQVKADKRGVDALATDDKSIASVVSIFASFANRAPVAKGLTLYKSVIQLRKRITAANVQSAYNCMVKVNRELEKLTKDMDSAQLKAHKVTDEWILAQITPKPQADKTDLARLEALIKQMDSLVKTERFAGLDRELDDLRKYRAGFEAATKAPAGNDELIKQIVNGETEAPKGETIQ